MRKSRKPGPEAAARLAVARDSLLRGLVGSQPVGLLDAMGARVVTIARHHVQQVVTEHGVVDLSVFDDDERPLALIELAHPDLPDSLRAALG